MPGCDDGADQGATNESTATGCAIVGTTAWWNQAFLEQTSSFQVEFAAVPSAPNIDAVIGLSSGATTRWTSLAAIVRFNPQGFIDARSGAEYKADVAIDYQYLVDRPVYFRMEVDITRHVYSVWVKLDVSSPTWQILAREYPFRTEQAAVTRLNNVASFVNPQTGAANGSVQVCGFDVTTAGTPGSSCTTSVAGSGFANTPITASSGALIVGVSGTPRQGFMDGVIGLGGGDVDAYNDLAAAVRFWTNGKIEVRDGDVYRADLDIAYVPGQIYNFTFVIDVPTKTYSVYMAEGDSYEAIVLAQNYKFRPQQLAVARLDRVASIIASPAGRLDVCGAANTATPKLRTALAGVYQVLPLADDGALITDGARSLRLAPNGPVAATLPVAGSLAQDSLGNFYIARITNGALVVDSYTATLQPRWTRIFGNDYGTLIMGGAKGIEGGGARVLVQRFDDSRGFVPERLLRIGVDGTFTYDNMWLGDMVVLGSDRIVTVVANPEAWYVTAYSSAGAQLWQRTFARTFWIHAMAIAPDGALVLGGDFYEVTNFGDGELERYNTPEGPMNVYVAVFGADGATRFSRHIPANSVTGVSTNGQRILVVADHWTQFPYAELHQFDNAGTHLGYWGDVGFGEHGLTAGGTIAPSGRIWATLRAAPYFPPWFMFPVLVSLDP
ncbi:MAG TPA: hypothetical protein VIV11_37600 [Kofleriaceae bacterium]